MIVSRRHKFIFLKTAKTAGSSIELALRRFCGPHDIITPLEAEDEAACDASYGPQNHFHFVDGVGESRTAIPCRWMTAARFYNHMDAVEARRLLGREIWNRYYKFCVVRNPWDRVISHYFWFHKYNPNRPPVEEGLKAFLLSDRPRMLQDRGWKIYTENNRPIINGSVRYEQLGLDLSVVAQVLDLPGRIELPRAKAWTRTDKRPYQAVYTDETREMVARAFKEEIDFFGYKF